MKRKCPRKKPARPTKKGDAGSDKLPTFCERDRFTGGYIAAREPAKYAAIVEALKDGEGVMAIAERLRCSHHTVLKIREREAKQLPPWKSHTARTLEKFATLGAERLVNEYDKIPVGQLPIAVAVALDKIAGLSGEPSAVVAHVSINANDLRARLNAMATRVVEVEGETTPHRVEGRGK